MSIHDNEIEYQQWREEKDDWEMNSSERSSSDLKESLCSKKTQLANKLAAEIVDEIENEIIGGKHAKAEQKIAARVRQLAEDAERYRYIVSELVRADPKMDGTSYWSFRQSLGRAMTFDELIDRKRGDQ